MNVTTTHPADTETTAEPAYGDPDDRELGELMGDIAAPEGEMKVAKAAVKKWESQDPILERPISQWKINAARRQGVTNAKLIRNTDDHWTAYIPKDASPDRRPDVNKAATLCRRFPSLLFTDPPSPDVVPSKGEEAEENRAEVTERVLLEVQGETGLNSVMKHRLAFDKGNDYGSGYIRYFIDPRGAGRQPIQLQAHPDATHVENALVNPATGMKEGPYVTRYVRPDGSLFDDPAGAAERWQPEIRSEVLDGRHVRLFPHTVADVWEAEMAQTVSFLTIGQLKRMWPDKFGAMPKEELARLLTFRPDITDDLIDKSFEGKEDDDKLVFVLTTYVDAKACADYPDGCYLITVGDRYVAYRDKWSVEIDGRSEPLMIPITQQKQFQEGRPFYAGVGLMEIVGGGNEIRSAQIVALLDHLEKLNNQKVFLPSNSILQQKDLQNPRATVLYVNPGGEPRYQEVAPYTPHSIEMYNMMGDEMNDSSTMQEAGQGMQDGGVNSGRQAYAIIGQVHAGLSEPRDNIIRGYTRGCRIEAQLVRAFYDTPRKMKWVGDDGAYKEKDWSGADLLTTTDIRLKPGTMTMLSPAAKAQYVEHLYGNLKLISSDDALDMLRTNVGGTVGLQDNPMLERIKRQISQWKQGPPEGWQPPQPVMQPQIGPMGAQMAPVMGPDGQPQMQPDPAATEIWEPVPSDMAADVAKVRYRELSRFMQTLAYQRKKPAWRAGLDAEFMRMAQVLMPAPQPPAPNQVQQPAAPGSPTGLMQEGVPQDNVNEGNAAA